MKIFAKYLLLLAVFTGIETASFAQDSTAAGEIMMTKSQLQSFLGKIAQLKRQQMAEQREKKLGQLEMKQENFSSNRDLYSSFGQRENETNDGQLTMYGNRQTNSTPGGLSGQLELINAKLNLVMSEIEVLKLRLALNSGSDYSVSDEQYLRPYQQQPQVRLEPKQQPVIINQGAPSRPYTRYVPQSNVPLKEKRTKTSSGGKDDSLLMVKQREQEVVHQRIQGLENELRLMQQLLNGSDSAERNTYRNQISQISSQIDSLNSQMARKKKDTDSLMVKKEDQLLSILDDFSYKVYFGNNSTSITPSDYSRLQDIVRIAKNNPRVTVVLRGFASKVGDPQYNEKISFQRAAAVKNWLLKNGLQQENIQTLHYGVDNSVDAARARRVEISFRTQ